MLTAHPTEVQRRSILEAELALATLLQVAAADSVPRITLKDALQRAARLDPGYVQALGQVDNAEWVRTAALTAFLVPAINLAWEAAAGSLGVNPLERLVREPGHWALVLLLATLTLTPLRHALTTAARAARWWTFNRNKLRSGGAGQRRSLRSRSSASL